MQILLPRGSTHRHVFISRTKIGKQGFFGFFCSKELEHSKCLQVGTSSINYGVFVQLNIRPLLKRIRQIYILTQKNVKICIFKGKFFGYVFDRYEQKIQRRNNSSVGDISAITSILLPYFQTSGTLTSISILWSLLPPLF